MANVSAAKSNTAVIYGKKYRVRSGGGNANPEWELEKKLQKLGTSAIAVTVAIPGSGN